jgi:hypothetical protein
MHPEHLRHFDYRGLHRYCLTFCTFGRQHHIIAASDVDLSPFPKRMRAVNPVGARSFARPRSLWKMCSSFPQDRQDSAAAFLEQGAAMTDLVVPPQYHARVKQRLKVLAYAEEHGLKPAARQFAHYNSPTWDWTQTD